jgi:hypothetical protein
MKAFRRKNDAQLTVITFDNVALPNRACDNSHVLSPELRARIRPRYSLLALIGGSVLAARTILILPPNATRVRLRSSLPFRHGVF